MTLEELPSSSNQPPARIVISKSALDDSLTSSSSSTSTMARILSILALVAATVVAQAEAATYCQCLFPNDSHCCVYSDAALGNLDCPRWCRNAHRADGKGTVLEPGTACNAGGKYKTVGAWHAQFRTPCYKQ